MKIIKRISAIIGFFILMTGGYFFVNDTNYYKSGWSVEKLLSIVLPCIGIGLILIRWGLDGFNNPEEYDIYKE